MEGAPNLWSAESSVLPLPRFEELEKRYQGLGIRARAQLMLDDAKPALKAAEEVLHHMAENPKTRAIISKLRKDTAVIHKMRPSEARNMLLDTHTDFIDVSRRKLQAWRKTMKRLARGEGIIQESGMEYIPRHLPVASAYSCITTTPHYLHIIQVILTELEKKDRKHAEKYHFSHVRVRRCSTVLSDCETAAAISAQMH